VVDLQTKTLCMDGMTECIIGFEVWFATPLGLCVTLEEAIEICEKNDIIVNLNVGPVAVAVTQSRRYEIISH